MTDNNDILPPLQNGEDVIANIPDFLKEDDWYDIDITEDWLDPADGYERPKYTLSYLGVPFAPLGGIHALTGQPGHGKTMTFTQLMVTILKGEYGNLEYMLSDTIPHPKVLYIDTEMEKGNTQLVNLRVYSLMNWSFGEPHDEFKVIMLRETENAVDRWRKTLKAIYEVQPTVCFIDGLLDVVSDFNNNEQCQAIIYKCMKVASHYGISLWCLVHQNPGALKMVGHMGSMLERKVTDALGTLKEKDETTGNVTFTVKQLKARGKDFKDWKFHVIQDKNNFGIPTQFDEMVLSDEEKEYIELKELNDTIRKSFENPLSGLESKTSLMHNIKTVAGLGQTRAYKLIEKALDKGILRKEKNQFAYVGLSIELQEKFKAAELFNPDEETNEAPF